MMVGGHSPLLVSHRRPLPELLQALRTPYPQQRLIVFAHFRRKAATTNYIASRHESFNLSRLSWARHIASVRFGYQRTVSTALNIRLLFILNRTKHEVSQLSGCCIFVFKFLYQLLSCRNDKRNIHEKLMLLQALFSLSAYVYRSWRNIQPLRPRISLNTFQ